MKKILLLLFTSFTLHIVDGQDIIIDNSPSYPLDDEHSNVSTESDRFGTDTYTFSADNFILTETTELDSAYFYGEKIAGFFSELYAFSIFIIENDTNNIPRVNPNLENALVHLKRIQPGEGFDVVNENGSDELDVGVDFTVANQGRPVVLPSGEYWIVGASYTPSAGAGDPTLSWTWRFSSEESLYSPKDISNQFANDINWNPVSDLIDATSLAWKLTAKSELTSIVNNDSQKIKLFPNPTSGIINVEPVNVDLMDVVVYDLLGKRVWNQRRVGSQLDISRLDQGTYCIELTTAKGGVKKIVIKH